MSGSGECVLGIDIGTTSVKVCLVDVRNREVIASQKKDTYSEVPSELGMYDKYLRFLMTLHFEWHKKLSKNLVFVMQDIAGIDL